MSGVEVQRVRGRGRQELTGRRARAFAWLYFATGAILAIWTLDHVRSPWPTLVAIGIFAAVCLLLTLDTGERLSLVAAVATGAAGVAMTLLVSWQVIVPGYSQWYFGAGVVALFYVCLRGRVGWAWIGYVAMCLAIALWGLTADGPSAVLLIARQLPIMVMGTLFAIGMRRTVDQIETLAADASTRVAAEAAAEATAAERRERLAELETLATPLLRRLARGQRMSAEDRVQFALAEAELRDSVRGRAFHGPAVSKAARAARRRGVDVMLLDDSGTPLPESELQRVRDAVVRALDAAEDGAVTARLMPAGRDQIATILVDGSTYAKQEIAREAPEQ